MNDSYPKTRFLWIFLSIIALSSCAQAPQNLATESYASSELSVTPAEADTAEASSPETPPQRKPQLIKRAELTVIVESLEETLQSVTVLLQRQQGDILRFSDYQPQNNSRRHTANLELRVPQDKLESTLDALTQLGSVENRLITAEDVSDQLVDTQARLRNLRKSEEMVLKIMERSGSVGEVLEVSNQLSNIRDSIERIDAQLRNLQNKVAYSTITLNLEVAVSATSQPQSNLGLQLKETWGKATYSMTQFTFGLIRLTLWLLAFSPYFLLVGGTVYGYRRWRKNKRKEINHSEPS